MPELVRLTSCRICVYADDHVPPHFHVLGPGWDAMVEMASLRVMRGSGPQTALNEAIGWARKPDNLYRLTAEWRRLNERE